MKKILFVDDDANILAAYERQLRKQFQIDTALGSREGIAAVESNQQYAVVVADMNMPEMNGVELLTRLRQKVPDTVRVMLTGNADQGTAIEAVNEGNIFRFLTKPCPPEKLAMVLDAALRQHELIVAEKELLERTLNGAIKVLNEILSMVDPQAFGRVDSLRESVHALARTLSIENVWEVEAAAMLAHIGSVTLPPQVLLKARASLALSPAEQDAVQRVPEITRNLLMSIPRLEEVARITYYQQKHFDGSGFPPGHVSGEDIPLGARLIKVLLDLAELESKGVSRIVSLEQLRDRNGWYDPKILDAAYTCFAPQAKVSGSRAKPSIAIALRDLRPCDILVSDVESKDGTPLFCSGHIFTQASIERLFNLARLDGIKEPIYIQKTT
jgi:response regulator RpfG family c-di-GMP phosphodiesterase